MKKEKTKQYEIFINGIPNFASIPDEVMEPFMNKLIENILKQMKESKDN